MERLDGKGRAMRVYERCGMSTCTTGVNYGVVEWIKRNTQECGRVERTGSEEFVKVYESESEAPDRRGRPLGRWKDRVEEYLGERGIGGREVLKPLSPFFQALLFCYSPSPFP